MCVLNGFIEMAFGLDLRGLHYFLQMSSAGLLIAVFVPGCTRAYCAYSALSGLPLPSLCRTCSCRLKGGFMHHIAFTPCAGASGMCQSVSVGTV